jgi:hypothetical protein
MTKARLCAQSRHRLPVVTALREAVKSLTKH